LNFFLGFGDIVSAKLNEDEDGNHLGYGYIHYCSPESAHKALEATEKTEVWGTLLEVKPFQKKNERIETLDINKNLYVKNLPENYSDKQVEALFGKYGKVVFAKVMKDDSGRVSAIVTFEKEENSLDAKKNLNAQKVNDHELFVDVLQKKSDRKKLLTNKIHEKNYQLNSKFKNCNLHIRNIPYDVNEEYLNEVFSTFGEIKSVKIQKYILVTKVNNEFKEYPTSKGFGFVCFNSEESAKKAKEEMNGKFLPKYEGWKRPLLIDFFMPRHERKQVFLRVNQQNNPQQRQQLPILNPYSSEMLNPMTFHPNLAKHVKNPMLNQFVPNQMRPQTKHKQPYKGQNPNQLQNVHPQQPKSDDPDIKLLNSLEDDGAKKDYLGEFIFKKIENHKLAQTHNFTIDKIGKITGMILGIDDLQEIIDICTDPSNLSARITEALALLDAQDI